MRLMRAFYFCLLEQCLLALPKSLEWIPHLSGVRDNSTDAVTKLPYKRSIPADRNFE
jgi:hypothetical protein